jgi:hypothetical protein
MQHARPFHLASQRGVCDLSCDVPGDIGCGHFDIPGCGHPGDCLRLGVCDFLSCGDCGSCDWPSRKRKGTQSKDGYVYIPPNSKWAEPEKRRDRDAA